MRFDEIRDPTGAFAFHLDWSFVSELYSPEDIQRLIEKHGVRGMVKIVNDTFEMSLYKTKVLQAGRLTNGKLAVVAI